MMAWIGGRWVKEFIFATIVPIHGYDSKRLCEIVILFKEICEVLRLANPMQLSTVPKRFSDNEIQLNRSK